MTAPPSAAGYWELRVPTSAEIGEGVTNCLWELGALGVAEEETGGATCLRAFYPVTIEPAWLAQQVHDYLEGLRTLGFAVHGGPEVIALMDGRWADAWREHFRPLGVGDRLLVAPPWEHPATSGRRLIVIEPGRAFGTGHHATTRGCLEAIERLTLTRPPSRAIDIGTGSGILAVAAALLGVDQVVAIDVDPDAVNAAAANADRNGVGDRVHGIIADVADVRLAPAPLVIANLLTAAHLRLAAQYAALVTPGGHLVLGGILGREAEAVATAIVPGGFAPIACRPSDEWMTMQFARGADGTAVLRDATIHDQR